MPVMSLVVCGETCIKNWLHFFFNSEQWKLSKYVISNMKSHGSLRWWEGPQDEAFGGLQ